MRVDMILAGPPGTGKTTTLLNRVEQYIQSGINPDEICFVAFTKKAAVEAKMRAAERFGLSSKDLIYFRTLHSLMFMQLGLNRKVVMGPGDYIQIGKMLGIWISLKSTYEEGGTQGMEKGDRLLFYENLARVRKMTPRELWETIPDEDIDVDELERLADTLKEYKLVNGKLDFTDMLQAFKDSNATLPGCRVMIVDEAQDLASLQWDIVRQLAKPLAALTIAGDDDQAIFRWAGADVEQFIDFPGELTVLRQSYRVPSAVMEVASSIINPVQHRIQKVWKPRAAVGAVEYITDIDELDMRQGSWYLLARNAFLLDDYVEYCTKLGYTFDCNKGSPINGPALQAVKLWEQLRKGKKLPVHQIKLIYDFMSTRDRIKYGYKQVLEKQDDDTMLSLPELRAAFGLATEDIWHVALDRLADEDREYFLTALRNGENLLKDPRIKISTIHGVKGGEADNVVLCTDMAMRTYKEMQENPDDEARVWYVAVTRCRERLFILSPKTNLCIPSLT